MTKPFFILTPCGTSLLTNTVDYGEKSVIIKYSNEKYYDTIPEEDIQIINAALNRAEKKLDDADIKTAAGLSAELNGIISVFNGRTPPKSSFHQLLCTDTFLGRKTAEIVEKWLKKHNVIANVRCQTDLQTKDMESFQCALADLTVWCDETLTDYMNSHHVIFNLTGGFKSVQGFLMTLSSFYAHETVYIFESGDLLRIPRLPLKMNGEQTILANLLFFRRAELKLPAKPCKNIAETLYLNIEEEYALSAWGELLWLKSRDEIYRKKIYPSPSQRLKYGPGFMKSVAKLSDDRKIQINRKIDQLAVVLETRECNLSSLDFKPLCGNPCPPSTHEMDAWSDQDAKRIFGHFDNDVFILDQLNKHL